MQCHRYIARAVFRVLWAADYPIAARLEDPDRGADEEPVENLAEIKAPTWEPTQTLPAL